MSGTISLAFGVSLVLAVGGAFALQSVEEIRNPLFVAIVLASTSLGLIVPVVHDAGEIDSEFGQVILASASLAEFGTILLVSLFFSRARRARRSGSKIVLLVGFAVLVVLVGLAMVEAGRSLRVSTTLRALEDTSAQLGVRIAILLLVGFVALAGELGIETILGAFIAGALLRVVDPEAHLTHVEFRRKVEAIGYGFLIPMFFVSSGARFDVDALIHSPGHLVLIPLFLVAMLVVRGVPAVLFRRWFSNGGSSPRGSCRRRRSRSSWSPPASASSWTCSTRRRRVARRRRPPLRHRLPPARALAARGQRRGPGG